MAFELFLKSIVAPQGGVNFSLKPHLFHEKFWYKLEGFQCIDGITRQFGTHIRWQYEAVSGNLSFIYKFKTNTGAEHLVIATQNEVYEVTVMNPFTKVDITGAAVFTNGDWSACTFNGVMYMSNATHGLYKWTGTGNMVAIPAAPDASFITFYHDHLVALGDGTNLRALNWSNEFDDATWTPAATNDAGGFQFTDTEELKCAYTLGDNLIIYRSNSISMLQYIGGDLVFLHRPMVYGAGALTKHSVVTLPSMHLVMGSESFYSYTGGDSIDRDLGLAINNKVFGREAALYEISLTLGPIVKSFNYREMRQAIWIYQADTLTSGEGGDCIVGYNYETGAWHGPVHPWSTTYNLGLNEAITAFVNDVQTSYTTFRYPYFTTYNSIYSFYDPETENVHDGVTYIIERYAETGDIFLGEGAVDYAGNAVGFPLSTVFIVESINLELSTLLMPPVDVDNCHVYIGYRKELNDAIVWSSPIVINYTNIVRIPTRALGRWFRLKFESHTNSPLPIAGFQFVFTPAGIR